MLEQTKFDVVSLDHDLGDYMTGWDVVDKLLELPEEQRPNQVIIHSANFPAGKKMAEALQEANFPNVEHRPSCF